MRAGCASLARGRAVATDIAQVDGTAAPEWHDAEWYHQNYNAKNKVGAAVGRLHVTGKIATEHLS